MYIENHIIKDISYQESSNHGGNNVLKEIDTIVIHYTGGASADSSIKTLCNPAVKASAHLVIAKDGAITQLVPFNIKAWHAGKSTHHSVNGLNKYSIGIEIDNPGRLQKVGTKFISWFGREYSVEKVIRAKHINEEFYSYWHTYSEEQINAVFELCELLVKKYNIKYIVGHDEIAPGRKSDPGPAFPMEKLRSQVLFHDRKEENETEYPKNAEVSVPFLNIRKKPSSKEPKVAAPLQRGTKVKIIDCNGDWYNVSVTINGWVMKKYLKSE